MQWVLDFEDVQPVLPPSGFDISPLLRHAIDIDPAEASEGFNYLAVGLSQPGVAVGAGAAASTSGKRTTKADDNGPARKKSKRGHTKLQKKRDQATVKDGHCPDPERAHQVINRGSTFTVKVPIELDNLPASSCGYRASTKKQPRMSTTTYPFVDPKTGRIFMVLVASPKDESWMGSCMGAFHAMEDARGRLIMEVLEIHHRRGSFPAINVDISYGQGPKRPHNLDNGPHSELMRALLKNEDVRRIAVFASAALSVWAPDLYAHYKTNLDSLLKKMPTLQRNFNKSTFACSAFNFEPMACTCAYRDCMNLPFGSSPWDIRPYKGRPSPVLAHPNITIQPGENRASFTQFTAGDLFRFLDNGFKTEEGLRKSVSKKIYAAKMKEKETRWELGLGKWSAMEDLVDRAQKKADVEKEEGEASDDEL
ncbi:hypothetical protein FA13DRAFT_1796938 [Coprinellus micaceus]|uniref:Uncharacterized protein n=1 Tax=Coprinellus micaceus TaxID=71717 RepID=A0A4Y7SSX1_COPMI|nr:hypothetical protein FA13DRAFT_1796938 [Coprinellus micaceus]